MNKLYKVYTHTAPNGDVYVGVTGKKYINQRWQPSDYRTTALQPYIEQYGWEAIKHEVIYTCEDKEEAYRVEEEMRQYYEEKGCCINMRRSGLVWSNDINAYHRHLYQNNNEYREKKNAYQRQWQKDNREKHNAYMRKYRAKKNAS